MDRRWTAARAPTWTTATAVLAIALIAGMALINTSRVRTPIPPGVYLPRSASVAPGSAPQDPASANSAGPGSAPTSVPTSASSVPRGGGTAVRTQTSASRPPAYRSQSGDTQVSTVAPNYPVDVSSEDSASPDGTSSGAQPGPTTTSVDR